MTSRRLPPPSGPAIDPLAGALATRFSEHLVRTAQGLTAVAKWVWPLPDKGLRRRLHRVSARTLVVFGSEDALVPPRYADDFVALIPDARSEIVPGASHMVTEEQRDRVLEAIDRFLPEASPSG